MLRLSVILAFFAILMSSTSWAANWNEASIKSNNNGFSEPSDGRPTTYVVPNDVLDKFTGADKKIKEVMCSVRGTFVYEEMAEIVANPPIRIKGLNSAMNNIPKVEGISETGKFVARFGEAVTDAFVNRDKKSEELLENLYRWAKANALSGTWNCWADKNCGGYWAKKDGSDPAPSHDIDQSYLAVHSLAYGYFFSLASFKPNDPRHVTIQNYLSKYSTSPKGAGKGHYVASLHTGMNWIELLFQQRAGNVNKKTIAKIIESNNKELLNDGSIDKRTTRGIRALHYHYVTLNEIMINMEIANRYGVEIPKEMHKKIEKAADLFVKGYRDYKYMNKWAKVAYNRPYRPNQQIFQPVMTQKPGGKSWMYIFQYRYPSSPVSNELKVILKNAGSAASDSAVGLGYGCIYAVVLESNSPGYLAESRIAKWRKDLEKKMLIKPIDIQSAKSKIYSDKDNFMGFRITVNGVGSDHSFKVMVDFDNKVQKESGDLKNLRVELVTDGYLDPLNTEAALKCKKANIKKKDHNLVAYRLFSGNRKEEENNECILSTMTEAGRKKAESLLATLGQIFANENVKKSDPYGVLEKHSKFLMKAGGN